MNFLHNNLSIKIAVYELELLLHIAAKYGWVSLLQVKTAALIDRHLLILVISTK